jgi:hypothetical protein
MSKYRWSYSHDAGRMDRRAASASHRPRLLLTMGRAKHPSHFPCTSYGNHFERLLSWSSKFNPFFLDKSQSQYQTALHTCAPNLHAGPRNSNYEIHKRTVLSVRVMSVRKAHQSCNLVGKCGPFIWIGAPAPVQDPEHEEMAAISR